MEKSHDDKSNSLVATPVSVKKSHGGGRDRRRRRKPPEVDETTTINNSSMPPLVRVDDIPTFDELNGSHLFGSTRRTTSQDTLDSGFVRTKSLDSLDEKNDGDDVTEATDPDVTDHGSDHDPCIINDARKNLKLQSPQGAFSNPTERKSTRAKAEDTKQMALGASFTATTSKQTKAAGNILPTPLSNDISTTLEKSSIIRNSSGRKQERIKSNGTAKGSSMRKVTSFSKVDELKKKDATTRKRSEGNKLKLDPQSERLSSNRLDNCTSGSKRGERKSSSKTIDSLTRSRRRDSMRTSKREGSRTKKASDKKSSLSPKTNTTRKMEVPDRRSNASSGSLSTRCSSNPSLSSLTREEFHRKKGLAVSKSGGDLSNSTTSRSLRKKNSNFYLPRNDSRGRKHCAQSVRVLSKELRSTPKRTLSSSDPGPSERRPTNETSKLSARRSNELDSSCIHRRRSGRRSTSKALDSISRHQRSRSASRRRARSLSRRATSLVIKNHPSRAHSVDRKVSDGTKNNLDIKPISRSDVSKGKIPTNEYLSSASDRFPTKIIPLNPSRVDVRKERDVSPKVEDLTPKKTSLSCSIHGNSSRQRLNKSLQGSMASLMDQSISRTTRGQRKTSSPPSTPAQRRQTKGSYQGLLTTPPPATTPSRKSRSSSIQKRLSGVTPVGQFALDQWDQNKSVQEQFADLLAD